MCYGAPAAAMRARISSQSGGFETRQEDTDARYASRYSPKPKKFAVGKDGPQIELSEAAGGGFGAKIWPSAKMLVAHMAVRGDLRGKRVVELGCGVGLAGIGAPPSPDRLQNSADIVCCARSAEDAFPRW